MTTEQVKELNDLLKDHAETLTAFYDEGIKYGMEYMKGYINGYIKGSLIIGASVGIGIGISQLIRKYKTEKENNEE